MQCAFRDVSCFHWYQAFGLFSRQTYFAVSYVATPMGKLYVHSYGGIFFRGISHLHVGLGSVFLCSRSTASHSHAHLGSYQSGQQTRAFRSIPAYVHMYHIRCTFGIQTPTCDMKSREETTICAIWCFRFFSNSHLLSRIIPILPHGVQSWLTTC